MLGNDFANRSKIVNGMREAGEVYFGQITQNLQATMSRILNIRVAHWIEFVNLGMYIDQYIAYKMSRKADATWHVAPGDFSYWESPLSVYEEMVDHFQFVTNETNVSMLQLARYAYYMCLRWPGLLVTGMDVLAFKKWLPKLLNNLTERTRFSIRFGQEVAKNIPGFTGDTSQYSAVAISDIIDAERRALIRDKKKRKAEERGRVQRSIDEDEYSDDEVVVEEPPLKSGKRNNGAKKSGANSIDEAASRLGGIQIKSDSDANSKSDDVMEVLQL
jgi:hypothetical protein